MELEYTEDTAIASDSDERFFIDTNWYDENDLSFNDVVQSRMCAQCQARLGEETEERLPVVDRKTGRVTYEVRKVEYGSRPISIVRDCCSRKSAYISPDMPVLESIFRIMLANANQPMELAHVREQLREWCPTGRCQWLVMPEEVLRQVLVGDRYYGLRLYDLPDVA
jgi:hypothetical protein